MAAYRISDWSLGAMQAIEETLLHKDWLFAEQMSPHPVYWYPPLAE